MSQYPAIYAGQFPDADTLQALAPLAAWKTTATDRTTTAKSIDPDLQLTLEANATYDVTADLIYSGTGGFSFGWTVPAGAAGGYAASFTLAGTGAGTWGYVWSATPEAGTGATEAIRLGGTLWTGSSAGTFGFNWAAFTGSDTVTLGAGSILRAKRTD